MPRLRSRSHGYPRNLRPCSPRSLRYLMTSTSLHATSREAGLRAGRPLLPAWHPRLFPCRRPPRPRFARPLDLGLPPQHAGRVRSRRSTQHRCDAACVIQPPQRSRSALVSSNTFYAHRRAATVGIFPGDAFARDATRKNAPCFIGCKRSRVWPPSFRTAALDI